MAQNARIVVVDDDKEFLEELKEVLHASGYEPIAVNEPELVLNTVKKEKPDLILMDLRMPGKTGFELADEINRVFLEEPIPIIAMSAYFSGDYMPLLNLCGIKRHIKKPFPPLSVISIIEDVLKTP